ncbi:MULTISPECIES: lytic transglycosylase domain-containing protein [Enterobacteriaceae]|uniref:lytic transglycosylase domain-containing protein n=1 Tax=Enterobacteriaceae TaxID=543 RepID=UPI00046FC794|nr:MULTISPECIES: transglycosylase SLT domain-containing protein [Enterobacteriaceae]DAP96281.1 MAG TPA: tail tape measure [Caudoviricetes sp.]EKW1876297.1 transglycosylase SLT domain-containing protein [Raoultella ornithinolytica]ELS1884704.1 transglycosylase SLT domain-containing protein [Raoultella ornithinolytica]KDV93111.1 transglycosylase SLT domain protein [Raoultella ornithinolytica 2-156-04_S1_C1]KDX13704.1 transglycosylase SLT domain protein [Raoultella ornithinolytica 2-156-04_S1_C2]
MSNAFDFELIADDRVSATIDEINEAIKNLLPHLDETQEKLNLGGDETVDSLDDVGGRLDKMARSARDNVQFIGDIIPPLKIVGELAGKMATFGAAGVVGYGIKKVADGFREAAKEAYNLDTHAQNTAMSVRDFTQLAGAMRILGADSESAASSIEGIFKALNEAASGKNAGVMSAMAQIGAQIEKNSDGSVNTLKTLESIAKIFPTLRPDQQKSVADGLGLTPELLTLMREGANYKKLLAKADEFGLTVDPGLNKQLSDVNVTMNELGAAWDGLINKSEKKVLKFVMSDGSVKNGLEGVTDLLTNGDLTALSHAAGFINTDEAEKLRRIQGNKELYNKLTRRERGAVDAGFMTDAVRKRYDAEYGATDAAERLRGDMSVIAPQKAPGNEKIPYRQNDNTSQYDDLLTEAGEKYGVDPRLLKAIMKQESKGDPYAISRAGARGLMQIIPSNFKSTGITDWTDPRQNIFAGAQIMAENMRNAGGNIPLALRYYNGGYDRSRWGRENAAYPGAVLGYYQDIISGDTGGNPSGINQERPGSIVQPTSDSGSVSVNDITKSFKSAMEDNKLKLEITTINEKGDRKVFETQNGGRITLPMSY